MLNDLLISVEKRVYFAEKRIGEDFLFHLLCFMNGLSLFVKVLVTRGILERNNNADDTIELTGRSIGEYL